MQEQATEEVAEKPVSPNRCFGIAARAGKNVNAKAKEKEKVVRNEGERKRPRAKQEEKSVSPDAIEKAVVREKVKKERNGRRRMAREE